MEMKDTVTAVGIVLTFAVGAWNLALTLRTSKEARYINIYTTERVKWIHELRANISKYCGAIHTWMTLYAGKQPSDPKEYELLHEIDRLRYFIRLQLNPAYGADENIERLILNIPKLTSNASLDDLQAALEAITKETQGLLNNEWQKVKKEAREGKLG
jgi:hypothetical protein